VPQQKSWNSVLVKNKKVPTLTGPGLVENVNRVPRLTGHSPQPSWTSIELELSTFRDDVLVVRIPTGSLVQHHNARLSTSPSSLAVRHDSHPRSKKKKKISLCSRREIAQQTSVPAAAEMKVVRFNIVRNGPGAVNVPPFRSSPLLLSLLDRAICLLALRGLPCFLRGARALPSSGFCGLAGCVLTLVCVAQLLPEEEDDMWHVYNLIGVGDHLEAVTVR
jgi:hypothetical protein